mgnify:FL=1
MRKAFLILATIIMIFLISKTNYSEEIIIPNDSIRIRVIANSNSEYDQKLKKNVKHSIQKQLSEMLKDASDINEVRKILKDNLGNIEYTVEKVFEKNKYNNSFEVKYGYNFFPKKIYRGIKYDEGTYESIVIKIGESKGGNWWCVLFPPLCLMDEEEEQMEDVEYKSFIKEIIDKYF